MFIHGVISLFMLSPLLKASECDSCSSESISRLHNENVIGYLERKEKKLDSCFCVNKCNINPEYNQSSSSDFCSPSEMQDTSCSSKNRVYQKRISSLKSELDSSFGLFAQAASLSSVTKKISFLENSNNRTNIHISTYVDFMLESSCFSVDTSAYNDYKMFLGIVWTKLHLDQRYLFLFSTILKYNKCSGSLLKFRSDNFYDMIAKILLIEENHPVVQKIECPNNFMADNLGILLYLWANLVRSNIEDFHPSTYIKFMANHFNSEPVNARNFPTKALNFIATLVQAAKIVQNQDDI